jgi:F-type H+-transporting ATPase subunit delta
MQGASREALAAARDQLEQLGSTGDPRQLTEVGEGLFAVVGLLEREVRLRRALADPALPADAKTSLVRGLLGGRLGEPALEVLDGVVSARWSRPGDVLDALDTLAASATLMAAEADGDLDDVEDELFRFSRIVDREPQLLMALTDQGMPLERKRELVHALLEGRARPATVRLVDEVMASPRGRTLNRALEGYAALAAERRRRLVAAVTVAVPLTDEEEDRLGAALAREFGSQVQLQVEVDPTVMGGVRVHVGDAVIDATVASRLAEARRRLVG